MKKIIFIVLSILFCSAFVFSQNNFERESVLTEEVLKSLIKNYKNLFNDLKSENAGKLIYTEKEESVRETFDRVLKVKRIFEKYGFNGDKGMYQILVLQYGIVACTIEETLNEIVNENRTEKQKENDRQTAAWLSEIKSQINSADYKLMQKYFEELYEIFNRIEEKI
ncbi:hypothetical protein [Treponema denticola]|uniref:hypothetical protein n=1 Tax=Treponema denticola TaxID=158 RepID=UPI00210801EF|nr:hypothetical protein [Treponema denticola]UTY27453.1 hypothetical protein E4N77_05635 [Treponema denticola]